MTTYIGFSASQVDTAFTNGKTFAPGNRAQDFNGKQYVYVKASSAIAQYDVVTFDETYITTVAPVATSNAARDDKIGVAPVAIASGSYGWLQIYGPCTLSVKSACAANAELTATTTGGTLDDATTASLVVIDGVVVTTANTASAVASAAGILNYPKVGRTL
jgi:hypothetical protein